MIENNIVQNLAALKALPNSWSIQPFEEVVKDISGGNKKTLKSDFLEKGEFVIVDQGQSLIAGYTNNKALLVKAPPPYVLFGDHTRVFKFIDVPFAMGADGTKVLKTKAESILIEKYLYYFFLTLNIPNTGYNRHFKYLKELKIPLPPLAGQQKIAAILDAADSLRQKDQQLVERYTALSQSLFLEMFGDPLGWGESKVNESWSKKQIKSIALLKRGYDLPVQSRIDGKISIFAANGIVGNHNVAKVKGPGVITGRSGTLGNVNYTENDFWPLNTSLYVTDFNNNNPLYISWFLTFYKLDRYHRGAGVPTLNRNLFLDEWSYLPSISLQNQFAERIQQIEAQKQQAQRSLEKSEDLFNSLLQRAFTGELTAKKAA